MADDAKLTTILSTKGQVIVPKAIRKRRGWEAGVRLEVEETPDGVLLRSAPAFPVTHPDDVYGVLAYSGPPKTIEEMDAGVAEEARRRDDRGRY
jgi:AbrB family looped-hinge helix DNA binding protein